MGLLLFLIEMNDITDIQDENLQIALSTDDRFFLTSQQHNPFPAHEKQLHRINKWLSVNELTLNLQQTYNLKFGRTESMSKTLRINEKLLKTENSIKNIWRSSLILTSHSKNTFPTSVKKRRIVGFLGYCEYTLKWGLKPVLYSLYQTNNRIWFISVWFTFRKSIET